MKLRLFPLAARIAAVAAGGLLLAASCAAQTIKLGMVNSLTGPFSVPGTTHKQGYEYCVDEINKRGGLLGRQVKLNISDNRSDPETTVSQLQRFISVDKTDLLLGTFSTLLSFPASSIAEQNQMVWIEPSDSAEQTHSRGYKYNFGLTLKPINYIGQTPVDAIFELQQAGDVDEADLPGPDAGPPEPEELLLETNIDDMNPQLVAPLIEALLAAGALDAWVTPILMKKGRPAHTVSALTPTGTLDAVRRVLFVESSTIGVRTTVVHKSALDREWIEVDVDGQCVRVKVARLDGAVVSANPEWEDVRVAAHALGRAAKDVLADATATARRSLG